MKWEQDLVKDIRSNNDSDDTDLPGDLKGYGWNQISSECGHQELINHFNTIKNTCNAILEIGVADHGFSKILQESKNANTIYIGVDLEDRSHLHKPENNVHVLRTSSNNYQEVVDYIHNLGINTLDFIFIDGLHSVNQILIDWEYTNLLSPTGSVGFHDTNFHPGSSKFVDALNKNIWSVQQPCSDKADWGIAFATRKTNT